MKIVYNKQDAERELREFERNEDVYRQEVEIYNSLRRALFFATSFILIAAKSWFAKDMFMDASVVMTATVISHACLLAVFLATHKKYRPEDFQSSNLRYYIATGGRDEISNVRFGFAGSFFRRHRFILAFDSKNDDNSVTEKILPLKLNLRINPTEKNNATLNLLEDSYDLPCGPWTA